MTVFDLAACLSDILHATGTELISFGIGSRLVIATLILSRELLFVITDHIILQLTHCLKLHTSNLREGYSSLMECVLWR